MIIDYTKNLSQYAPILNNLDAALAAVKALPSWEVGTYQFEGGYFMIQKGTTNPIHNGDFEAHRKYVDVQLVLEGSELIAWKEIDQTEVVLYEEDKDKVTCKGSVEEIIEMKTGMCWVAYPNDCHKGCGHIDAPTTYTKAVIKLPV